MSVMAHQIRRRPGDALLGEARSVIPDYGRFTFVNSNPEAKQKNTFTVTGATNAKTYTVTINGIAVSYTASGAATVAEIADGLAAAIGAEGSVNANVEATSDGVDTVTVESRNAGIAFTLTEADAQITTASVTANASAAAVPFGVACFVTGEDDIAGSLASLALSSYFVAQVDTLLPTYVASAEYHATVIYDGAVYHADAAAGGNQAAASAALLAALEDALALLPLTVSADGNNVLITADTAGDSFESSIYAIDGGGGLPVPTRSSTRSRATSLVDSFAGVAERAYTVEGTEYPANFGFSAIRKGEVWVADPGAAVGDRVYVDGTDATFSNAAGANMIPLPGDKARFGGVSRDSDDALAWLDLRF